MADTFTPNLNLRKPEVGAAFDTWGGVTGLNSDMDLLDAVFLATGLGSSVGLHVGVGKILNVEGTAVFADSTDTTKGAKLDSSLITTATVRTFNWPDEDGIIATRTYMDRKVPVGTVFSGYYGATPPPGYVFLDGRTIGDATSSATNRANADTLNLFTLMWNLGAVTLPSKGASAAADWAVHRQIVLPDHSGRTMAGRDDLSGTNKNILSPGFPPGLSIQRGNVGGQATDPAQTVSVGSIAGPVSVSGTVSVTSSGMNTPDVTVPVQAGTGATVAGDVHRHGNVLSSSGPITINGTIGAGATGSGLTTAVTNVQPTIVVDVVISL